MSEKAQWRARRDALNRDAQLDDDIQEDQMPRPSSSKKTTRWKRILRKESSDEEYIPPTRQATRRVVLSDSEEESPVVKNNGKKVAIHSSSENDSQAGIMDNSPTEGGAEAEFNRCIDELMQDGYTTEQAYIIMDERSAPRPSQLRPLEKNPEGYYAALSYNGFKGTLYPHKETLELLGIADDVSLMLDVAGMSKLAEMIYPCYKEETTQFLATIQTKVHRNLTLEQLTTNGGGFIKFIVNATEHEFSFKQLQELYGFEAGAPGQPRIAEDELDEVWFMLSGEKPFAPARSKGNRIRNPAVNIARRVIGNLLYSRPSPGPINIGEMQQLDIILSTIIGTTATGKELGGDYASSGLAYTLAKQFMVYRTRAMTQMMRQKKKPVSIGGVVTPLLMACGVELNNDEYNIVAPRFLDLKKLRSSEVLSKKTPKEQLAYNLYHPSKHDAVILIPCKELSSLTSIQNVEFAHPLDVFQRVGSVTRPEHQQAESESEDEPEKYLFDEYTNPKMGAPVKEAHKRIGKLQRLGKWLVKTVKNLTKEKSEWIEEREQIRREMAELKEKFISEPHREQAEVAPQRHSVSIDGTFASAQSAPSQARHSSAEVKERKMTRKIRPSRKAIAKMRYGANWRARMYGEPSEPTEAAEENENPAPEPIPTPASYTLEEMNASTARIFDP